MPTEVPGYSLLVEVNGQQLPADVAALMHGGYIDNSLNVPDLFVLYFSDDHGIVIDKGHFSISATVRVSVQGVDNSGPKVLLNGEVTALETEIDSAGKHLIVRGFDKSHRLFRGTRVAAYVNVKPSDIAAQLAQGAGLSAGTMTSKGSVRKHVIQPGISDWDFLCELAATIGVEVSVVDGALNFQDPVKADGAPASTDSSQSPLVLEFGHNLASLRATVTAADQVPNVEVRGWDPKTKQATVGTQSAQTHSAVLDQVSPSALAGDFSSPKWTESNSSLTSQDEAQNRAAALADRLAGSFAELDGVANGNPEMRAGKAVTLANVGKPFDGKYTLTSTRHDFSPEANYRVLFTVSNTSDRSFYGVSTGAGAGMGRPQRAPLIDGVVPAIVTAIKDEDSQGRVKVKIPVLADDMETGWSRVVQLGAGGSRGVVWLPEVGDEVLVAFGMGHVDEMYVLGGLFNGSDQPDKSWGEHVDSGSGAVSRRALVSRTGMLVEMVEDSSNEQFVISAASGSQQIKIMQNGDQSIAITASGPVNVTTQKDATVDASSGTLTLKGQTISIEATNALNLKGVNITVKASAQADLEGSAGTTIKGATVQIN